MSLIQTRGAASARGFGLFGGAAGCCLNDGNKGIFALGEAPATNNRTRNKYTYATCLSTACGVASASADAKCECCRILSHPLLDCACT